jgi:hypothetical protein
MADEFEITKAGTVSVSGRTILALSAAGALAAALPSCSRHHKTGSHPTSSGQPQTGEPNELENEGYDPRSGEPTGTPEPPKNPGEVPKAASVKTDWLPPVGHQYFGDCCAWSTVYGLATFYAARKSQTPPKTPDLQASPDYAYVRYAQANKIPTKSCPGGSVSKCLDWLRSNGGAPSLAAAPNAEKKSSKQATCDLDWSDYGSRIIPPDPRFLIPPYKSIQLKGADGLKNLRATIAAGFPLAYGTLYYTDFFSYKGSAVYAGNGEVRKDDKGEPKGHAMMIIGYDDTRGAVRIQNSHGTSFGDKGYIWMAHDTFQKLSQGAACYVPDSA